MDKRMEQITLLFASMKAYRELFDLYSFTHTKRFIKNHPNFNNIVMVEDLSQLALQSRKLMEEIYPGIS